MKKLLTLLLSIVLIISLFIFPASANEDEIEGNVVYIPKISNGAIIVDAQKDASGYGEEMPLIENNLHRWPNSPMTSEGKFWTAYDDNYIYIFIDIEDTDIDYSNPEPEKTWLRESVGIIFDFDYRRRTESKYDNRAYNVCYINLSGDGQVVTYHKYDKEHVNGLYQRIETKTVSQTNDGHILYELALPIPEDVSRESGTKFGFEICAPNASEGGRVGSLSWSMFGSDMDTYTDVCGTAIFGENPNAANDNDSSDTSSDKKGDKDNTSNTGDNPDNPSDDAVVGAIDTTPILIITICVFGGIILLGLIAVVILLVVNANKKKKKAAKKAVKKEKAE